MIKQMQNLSPITVIKASGNREPFNEEKVVRSLSSTGLSLDTASQAVDYLKRHLKPEISTGAIYGHVSSYLQENAPTENYFNYGLKRAVMAMGPSGFPFEILISDLLKLDNYKTAVDVVTQGKCVTHEIDVIAQKGKDKYYIECKYHNAPGFKTDIQVALYTYARFLDINSIQSDPSGTVENHSWLITNTKITSEVLTYCQCVDLKFTTWNLPKGRGLQDMIVASGLHPVTLLYGISKEKINTLLDRSIVTCSRLKTAILNHQVDDILDKRETAFILENIAKICKDK
jgi:hypothetical protein